MRHATIEPLFVALVGIQLPLSVQHHPFPRQAVPLLRLFQPLILVILYLEIDVRHTTSYSTNTLKFV